MIEEMYGRVIGIPNVNLAYCEVTYDASFTMTSNVEIVTIVAYKEGTAPTFNCTSDSATVEILKTEYNQLYYNAYLVKGEIGDSVTLSCSSKASFMRFAIY